MPSYSGDRCFAALARWWISGLVFALLALSVIHVPAQDGSLEHGENNQNAHDSSSVVAYLGKQPITLAEVYFHLGRKLPAEGASDGAETLPPPSWTTLQNAVQLLALQRQALQTLRELKLSPEVEEIEQWIESRENANARGKSADQIAEEIGKRFSIPVRVFLDQVEFRLAWKRYLAKHLNDVNVGRHFASQKSRFDGSKFKIWMISIAVPAGRCQARGRAAQQLEKLANEFGDGVTRGQAQEALNEQELEISQEQWVRGVGDVATPVVDALLRMEPGQGSEIVHTASGVHLVRLTDREAGHLKLESVAADVRMHMLEFLLNYLASQSSDVLPLRGSE